ncbi:MAG: DUF4838 domain-containing protein [Verrucomicrobiae bacterium]|nr:DUF4838 domain-containing protein [Verrucomicrobiae bacterium]
MKPLPQLALMAACLVAGAARSTAVSEGGLLRLTDAEGLVRVFSLDESATRGFLAEEVALHLRELTGRAHPGPKRITACAAAKVPALLLEHDPALGPEAYAAEVRDGLVRIRGGDTRGLYYGVMAFFEALGGRWYAPGAFGTEVPRLKEVALPANWRAEGKPFLPWRGYHICGTGRDRDGTPKDHFDHETLLWMARNRMNFKPIHVSQYDDVAPRLREYLIEPLAFGHSYSNWIPASDYEKHPDFFPLVDGKRLREGQRCLSNPELQRTVVERIVAYADRRPDLRILSLAPNDGYRWCQCLECATMDSPEDRAKGELHRRNHLFAEKIIRAVRKQRPGVVISTISYSNYTEPGADVPPEKGLALSMCVTGAVNRGLDDPKSAWAALYRGRIARWRAKAGPIFWSEYLLSYGGAFPRPCEETILRTIRELKRQGVEGFKSEVVPGNFDVWRSASFLMYVVARGLYDETANADTLLDDFCRNFYGPAAEPARRTLLAHREAMRRFPDDLPMLAAQEVPRIWTADDLARVGRATADATKAVAQAPAVFRERVGVLQRQATELARTRREVERAATESRDVRAARLGPAPDFADFAPLPWTEQRQRFNWLPYDPPSRFAAGWNETALWLCFRLGEPDLSKAFDFARVRKGDAFHVSAVDTFYCPKPESGVYYQFAVSITGEKYMARCVGRQQDSGWNLKPVVRIRPHDSGWDLLVGLPYAGLETTTPSPGDRWKLSLNRAQSSGAPAVMGGWPTGGVWHKIEKMGGLVFEERKPVARHETVPASSARK